MTVVLVDANNVRRSRWPNLRPDELLDRTRAWAERHDHELVIVFDREAPGGITGEQRLDERTTLVGSGGESADDWLIREAPRFAGAWLVTSDRALREAAGSNAAWVVGGGAFLRELGD